jgi:hypothetical protein
MAKIRKGFSKINIDDIIPEFYHAELRVYGAIVYLTAAKKKKKYLRAAYKGLFSISANTLSTIVTISPIFSFDRGLYKIINLLVSEMDLALQDFVKFPGAFYEELEFGNSPTYNSSYLNRTETVPYPLANWSDPDNLFAEANGYFQLVRPTVPASYAQILHSLAGTTPTGDNLVQTMLNYFHRGWNGSCPNPYLNNKRYAAHLTAAFYNDWVSPNPSGFIKYNTGYANSDFVIDGAVIFDATVVFVEPLITGISINRLDSRQPHLLGGELLYAKQGTGGDSQFMMDFGDLLSVLDIQNIGLGHPVYMSQSYFITVPEIITIPQGEDQYHNPPEPDDPFFTPAYDLPWESIEALFVPGFGIVNCELTFNSSGTSIEIKALTPGPVVFCRPVINEQVSNLTNPSLNSYREGDTINYIVEGYYSTSSDLLVLTSSVDCAVEPKLTFENFTGEDQYIFNWSGWRPGYGEFFGNNFNLPFAYKITANGYQLTTESGVIWADLSLAPAPNYIRRYTTPQNTALDGSVTTIERIDQISGGWSTNFSDEAEEITMIGGPSLMGDIVTSYEEYRGGESLELPNSYGNFRISLNGVIWHSYDVVPGFDTNSEDIAQYYVHSRTQQKHGVRTAILGPVENGVTKLASYEAWREPKPAYGPDFNNSFGPVFWAPSTFNTELPLVISGGGSFVTLPVQFYRIYLLNQKFEQIGLFECRYSPEYSKISPFLGLPSEDVPLFTRHNATKTETVNLCLEKHDKNWYAAIQNGTTGSFVPELDEFGVYKYQLSPADIALLQNTRAQRVDLDRLLDSGSLQILYNDFMTYELFSLAPPPGTVPVSFIVTNDEDL